MTTLNKLIDWLIEWFLLPLIIFSKKKLKKKKKKKKGKLKKLLNDSQPEYVLSMFLKFWLISAWMFLLKKGSNKINECTQLSFHYIFVSWDMTLTSRNINFTSKNGLFQPRLPPLFFIPSRNPAGMKISARSPRVRPKLLQFTASWWTN